MCACHGLEKERTYRETLLRTHSGCRALYSASLGTASLHGLERPVCDPSLGPGTGLAQSDRSRGLPA
jgi:hypothetical protein